MQFMRVLNYLKNLSFEQKQRGAVMSLVDYAAMSYQELRRYFLTIKMILLHFQHGYYRALPQRTFSKTW